MRVKPTLAELKGHLRTEHTHFPLAGRIDVESDQWFGLARHLMQQAAYHVLLESGRTGRYHLVAYQPQAVLKGKEGRLETLLLNGSGSVVDRIETTGPLLEQLRDWLKRYHAPVYAGLPHFCGGLIGLFSYDLGREIYALPNQSRDDLRTPDLYLLAADRLLVYDQWEKACWLIGYFPFTGQLEHDYDEALHQLQCWREKIQASWNHSASDNEQNDSLRDSVDEAGQGGMEEVLTHVSTAYSDSLTEAQFMQAVERVQAAIRSREVKQVNLSLRQSRPLHVPPIEIYAALRQINPSPYMGYLHTPDWQIVCGSPEQLIRLQDGQLNSRPIAGTRPRGKDEAEDRLLQKELLAHVKERQEHQMLVELVQEELGEVSATGSVRVTEEMVLEAYSHVMHLVSNVEGELRPELDALDVLRTIFPGGTITGLPKERTMQLIEELETVRRGFYTGSLGWIDYNGQMELNIVIRTLIAHQGWAHVQAGAGIVSQSIPEREYRESLAKAAALWEATAAGEAAWRSGMQGSQCEAKEGRDG